jgi:presenilin-like A22 family membrane protease
MLSDQPGAGLPYLGFIAIGAFLLALVLAELPAVLAGRYA